MPPDEPNADKRASYAEQAARAGAAPPVDDRQPRNGAGEPPSPAKDVASSAADAQPPGVDNIVTGDQPPLHGAASHATGHGQTDGSVPASGGSSTDW